MPRADKDKNEHKKSKQKAAQNLLALQFHL
jgi:hypothetical protein